MDAPRQQPIPTTNQHEYNLEGIKIKSPYKLYQGQIQYISYILRCLNNQQNALVQSPTGSGKTVSLLLATISWLKHNSIKNSNKQKEKIRIIYTSRTHSQLKQAVNQLKKLPYQPKIALLASRQHSCINGQLRMMTENSKNLQCRLRVARKAGLSCKFFHHEEYYKTMNSIGRIADLQQISSLGLNKYFCPYYYEKSAKQIAQLIFMPYNYLFDKEFSQENISPSNCIVIIDEAHNVHNVCQQSQQYSISLNILTNSIHQFSELRQEKLKQSKQQQKKQITNISLSIIQLHTSFITLIHSHIQQYSLSFDEEGITMTIPQLLQLIQNATENGQQGPLLNRIKDIQLSIQPLKTSIQFRPFWAIQGWIKFVAKIISFINFKQKLEAYRCHLVPEGSDIKLNIFCLDPFYGFQNIMKQKPYNVILTSGTLSPLKTWSIQLQIPFNNPLACPHTIKSQQISCSVLTAGPLGTKLNFSFENRNNIQLFQELGNILLQIFKSTPNGIVLFFPSYGLLEATKKHLLNSNTVGKLYSSKNLFYQQKNSKNFKVTLNSYLKQAKKKQGAALFALVRGKVAEGLDLSDDLCRAVVMIGVPYPAIKDPKIIAKMKYLDAKYKQNPKNAIAGNQWYILETIRAINQSIGRIIRHSKDYGSIYFLDQRYLKNDLKSQISSWVKDNLQIPTNFQQFKNIITKFTEYSNQIKTIQQQPWEQFTLTSHLGTKIGSSLQTILTKNRCSISRKLPPKTTQQDQKDFISRLKEKINQQKNQQEAGNAKKQSFQRMIFAKAPKVVPIDQLKECGVCRIQKKLIKNSQCPHQFCAECWQIWLKTDLRCPICRTRMRQKYLLKQK